MSHRDLIIALYVCLALLVAVGAYCVYLSFVAETWGNVAASARAVEQALKRRPS